MTDALVVEGTASADAGRLSLSKTQANLVFATVALGLLLSALDQTVVATALPTIVSDLGGAGHLSWVVTSYLLAQTVSTAVAGRFGDLFGRKRVFQVSVLIFIVGSFFCGLAPSLIVLIAMRAVQGLGGGGITVTATALIGDVIPLRDRGKYQGALGAVFGVTTVIGPLLGGVLTDDVSWRWVFYINVPIAIIVILMAARTIPGLAGSTHPKIDYWGVLFIAIGSTGLVLATSWGGTQYPWGSAEIISLFAISIAAVVIFVFVELHAAEPILPMRLFRGRVFATASVLSFIVGFAMLGSITFLPTYLQYVSGASATLSGVRTLPMVIGLLVTAVGSGLVVGRTGKYKAFPIAGGAVTAVGLFLLSRMDAHTPVWLQSLFMIVLGAGIGLIMQILTLVVQNTADYRDLGAATSGVTFFRTLGGAFGASIMGTVYANQLKTNLPKAIASAGATSDHAVDFTNPAAVHDLPESIRALVVHVYAQSLHYVFLFAVPVAVVAFLLALTLPQVKMRGTAQELATGAGDGFAVPENADSDAQLENVIGRILSKTDRNANARGLLSRSGSELDIPTAWGLIGVYLRRHLLGGAPKQSDIEDRVGIPYGVLTSFFDGIADLGYLRRRDDLLELTQEGEEQIILVIEEWKKWLAEQLHDWLPPEQADLAEAETLNAALRRIVTRVLMDQQQEELPA
jgi:EmrB/QacA subfamily drug resistance transporter